MIRRSSLLWALALLLPVSVPLLSGLTRVGVEHALRSAGAERVEMASAFFNPLTGELAVDGVRMWAGDEETSLERLRVDLAWWPLLSRRVVLSGVRLEGLRLALSESADGLRIAGLPVPAAEGGEEGAGWQVGVGVVELADIELIYRTPRERHRLALERLLLTGYASWRPDTPAILRLTGTLDDAPLRIEGKLLAALPAFDGWLRLERLAAAPFAPRLATLERLEGVLSMEGDLRLRGGERPTAGYRGRLTVEEAVLVAEGRRIGVEGVSWRGAVDVTLAADGPRLSADGALDGRGVAAELSADERVALERFAWGGTAGVGAEGANLSGTARLTGVALERGGRVWLEGETLQLEGIALAGASVRAATAGAEGLRLLPGAAAAPMLAEIARLNLAGLSYGPEHGVALDEVAVTGLKARLARDQKGTWPQLAGLGAGDEGAGEKGPGAPPLRIGALSIGGDSELHFSDRSVKPTFDTTVRLERLSLGAVDSLKPGRAAPLALKAAVGDYSGIEGRGELAPFGTPVALRMEGRLHGVDLPPLSSYTGRLLGYHLTSGQLDADIELKLGKGRIEGENRLVLNRLTVEALDPKKMEGMTAELAIPLETALALLQDERGDVRLTLPVSGALDDPKFDLSDAINQALGKTMKTAAVGYLKLALQPFGTLLTLAQVAGESASRIRLDPLPFEGGESLFDDGAGAYLAKVAGVLKERPGLRLSLCGVAVAADRAALSAAKAAARKDAPKAKGAEPPEVSEEALLALARERAEAVKARLVKDLDADPKRLFVCHPKVAEEGGGRVELMI